MNGEVIIHPTAHLRAARSRAMALELSIRMALAVLDDFSMSKDKRLDLTRKYLQLFLTIKGDFDGDGSESDAGDGS
jgi:hypothetical protein